MKRRRAPLSPIDHLIAALFGAGLAVLVMGVVWRFAPYGSLDFGDVEDRLPLIGIWACTAVLGVIGYRVCARYFNIQRWVRLEPTRVETPLPDRLVVEFLKDHDQPCPGCSYNLRSLSTSTCPECNESFSLLAGTRSGSLMPSDAGLWAGMVCSALASGVVACCTGTELWERYKWFSAAGWYRRDEAGLFAAFLVAFVFSAIFLVMLALRVFGWRKGPLERRLRWAATTQAVLMILNALWMVSIGVLMVFLVRYR
jgi:hypothetical protein